jgi:hypothetical protein
VSKEELKRRAKEEEEQKKADKKREEERKKEDERRAKEDEKRAKEEAKRKAEEDAKRAKEDAIAKKKAEEDERKRKKEEEEEAKRKAEEDARKAKEDAIAKKKADEEEKRRKKEEEEEAKRKAEEDAKKAKEDEKRRKKEEEEEAKRRKKEEEEEAKRKKKGKGDAPATVEETPVVPAPAPAAAVAEPAPAPAAAPAAAAAPVVAEPAPVQPVPSAESNTSEDEPLPPKPTRKPPPGAVAVMMVPPPVKKKEEAAPKPKEEEQPAAAHPAPTPAATTSSSTATPPPTAPKPKVAAGEPEAPASHSHAHTPAPAAAKRPPPPSASPSTSSAEVVLPPSQRIEQQQQQQQQQPKVESPSPAPRAIPAHVHASPSGASSSSLDGAEAAKRGRGSSLSAMGSEDLDHPTLERVARSKTIGKGRHAPTRPKNTIEDPLAGMIPADSPASAAAQRMFLRISMQPNRASTVSDYMLEMVGRLSSKDDEEIDDVLRVIVTMTDNSETKVRLEKYALVKPIGEIIARGGDNVERKKLVAKLISNLLRAHENQEYWANSKEAMDALRDQIAQAQVWITMPGERNKDYHDIVAISCQCLHKMASNMWLQPVLVRAHVPETCLEIMINSAVSVRALLFAGVCLLHLGEPGSGPFNADERGIVKSLEAALHHTDGRARSLALELIVGLIAQPHHLQRLLISGFLSVLTGAIDTARPNPSLVVDTEVLRILSVIIKDETCAHVVFPNKDLLKKAISALAKNTQEPIKSMTKLVLDDLKLVSKPKK